MAITYLSPKPVQPNQTTSSHQKAITPLRGHFLDANLAQGDELMLQVLKKPGRAARTNAFT